MEDYFSIFKIESDDDQKKRFLEMLFEKARRWASTIEIDKLDGYKYDDKYTKAQKENSFKWQFLKRFAKEGRTVHAAFEAMRNLKFDPIKDDVEAFMTNVKNLATTLEFNQDTQIMAIKSIMPRDIYGLCMQYNELDKLKKFLIELFENPRMKSEVPSLAPAADTSAFSMGEYVKNDVVSATSDDIGKLKHEIQSLQFKIRRMTSADSRSKQNSKPWKPEITLPEGEVVVLEVKEVDKMILVDRLVLIIVQMVTVVVVEIPMVEISQGTVAAMVSHLAIRVKIMVTLVETKEIEVEEGLTPAQMSDGLE